MLLQAAFEHMSEMHQNKFSQLVQFNGSLCINRIPSFLCAWKMLKRDETASLISSRSSMLSITANAKHKQIKFSFRFFTAWPVVHAVEKELAGRRNWCSRSTVAGT